MAEVHWGEGADRADPASILRVAGDIGLDGQAWLDLSHTPDMNLAYASNTYEAIRQGALGSPTYFVYGDMFYDQDRLELVA